MPNKRKRYGPTKANSILLTAKQRRRIVHKSKVGSDKGKRKPTGSRRWFS